MLKEKDLRIFRSTRNYKNGEKGSLENIQREIAEKAEEYGIPVKFEKTQVKSGGFFSSSVSDAIIIFNAEHVKDYYRIIVALDQQQTASQVSVYDYGESKNLKKLNAREAAGNTVKTGWKLAGNSGNSSPGMTLVGGALGGAVGALRSLGGSKAKQESENNYYAILAEILDEIL